MGVFWKCVDIEECTNRATELGNGHRLFWSTVNVICNRQQIVQKPLESLFCICRKRGCVAEAILKQQTNRGYATRGRCSLSLCPFIKYSFPLFEISIVNEEDRRPTYSPSLNPKQQNCPFPPSTQSQTISTYPSGSCYCCC